MFLCLQAWSRNVSRWATSETTICAIALGFVTLSTNHSWGILHFPLFWPHGLGIRSTDYSWDVHQFLCTRGKVESIWAFTLWRTPSKSGAFDSTRFSRLEDVLRRSIENNVFFRTPPLETNETSNFNIVWVDKLVPNQRFNQHTLLFTCRTMG